MRRRDFSVERYLGGSIAGQRADVASMFTLPAVTVANEWANASHIAKATDARPLEHLGGGT